MSFWEIVKSGLEGLVGMVKGAYAFGQSSFGDFIIISVAGIIGLLILKKTMDSGARVGQTAARTAEAGSMAMSSASDMFTVVIILVLLIGGFYKSEGITGYSGKLKDGEAELKIEKSTDPGFENFRNPLKEPSPPNKEKYSLTDEEILQYYFALQDSIDNSRKEAVDQESTKIQKSGFWEDLSKFEEGLQNFFGLDGNFKKKKK
jgi:hypothetical protein